jgi:hypothetical protein
MKTAGAGQAIQFRGEPSRVEGYLQVRHDLSIDRAHLVARIDAAEVITLQRPLVQSVTAGEAITRFVLRLPGSTPPGTYYGALHIGEQTHPLEAVVDASPKLVLMPSRLTLTVAPGHEELVELLATNTGNTVFEVPREGFINLLDSEGLSVAVNSALSSKEKGQERVNRFVDSVARSTGTAQVEVQAGAGEIAPGAIRRLTVRLRLPKSLQPGHAYRGGWELPNARYVVQVYVPAAVPPEEKAS